MNNEQQKSPRTLKGIVEVWKEYKKTADNISSIVVYNTSDLRKDQKQFLFAETYAYIKFEIEQDRVDRKEYFNFANESIEYIENETGVSFDGIQKHKIHIDIAVEALEYDSDLEYKPIRLKERVFLLERAIKQGKKAIKDQSKTMNSLTNKNEKDSLTVSIKEIERRVKVAKNQLKEVKEELEIAEKELEKTEVVH